MVLSALLSARSALRVQVMSTKLVVLLAMSLLLLLLVTASALKVWAVLAMPVLLLSKVLLPVSVSLSSKHKDDKVLVISEALA